MQNRWIKWLGIGLLGLFGFAVLTAAGAFFWFQRTVSVSQPQVSGTIRVAGIRAPVEIVRDVHGIPHIYAQSEPDLFFAMGYAMAQDRLWQMEFYRRVGTGRLAEILGKRALAADRHFRTLAAASRRRRLPDEVSLLTDAFAAGVNAFLEEHRDRLPLEFKLLGFQPEPWQADDVSSIYTLINWGLSLGWKVDLTAAEILKKVGEDRFQEAFAPPADTGRPIALEIVPTPTLDFSGVVATFLKVSRLIGFTPAAASNNWVISGDRSETGKPLLANDTHMPLTNPCLWWEVHLVCPTINATGFAIPGLPSLPLGRNRHVAWGITNVMVDDVDFYIERLNPQNPLQYRYEDRWEDMQSIRQTIRVKGAAPVDIDIRLTRHGPVIENERSGETNQVVSARWAVNELELPARAAFRLLKAATVADVVAALKDWETPGQNFVFADTDGSIGYWCCAAIPIRPRGNGLLPVPGWTGADEWVGYLPFTKRPHVIDPPDGYVASANNALTDSTFPHVIGTYWEPIDRISRIRNLITTKPRVSVDDMAAMQTDVACPLAAELMPLMLRVMDQRFPATSEAPVRDILAQWDYRMAEQSAAASIYETTYLNLLENIFKDELGPALYRRYLGLTVFAPRALRHILRTGRSGWLDDVGTPQTETLADAVEKSLRQALTDLRNRFGADVKHWTWDRLHTLTFRHPLGERKPLDRLFDLGPYPTSGSHLTVNKKQYDYTRPFSVREGASQRMIVDLANPAVALHVLPTGESGLLGNAHNSDQIDLYLEGGYHPSWLTRSDIEHHAEATLELIPR
ncbi:MAG: penicillin acylase family protein [Desulfobacterales bacterium]|jgi:penicillin amidase